MRPLLSCLVLAFAFAVALTSSRVAQAAPVDLSGTWVLDKVASGDLEPLLRARGASWMERKAVKGMSITQTIAQDGDTLRIEVDTSLKDTEETVQVDGVARKQKTPRGEVATVTHRWEGAAWVSHSVLKAPSGEAVALTRTTRVSPDGASLTTHIRVVRGDEAPVEVSRVYRRQ